MAETARDDDPDRGEEGHDDPGATRIPFLDLQPEIVGSRRTNPPGPLIAAAVARARIGKLFDRPMVVSLVPVAAIIR